MIDAAILAKSGEAVKAGPIGLAVILLLCIACYFLFKSMSKHLRKVREHFPADPPVTGSSRPGNQPSAPSRPDVAHPQAPTTAPDPPGDDPTE